MNTPRHTPPPGTPNPETAPTAPPLMPNLLRRRKTQYLLRRRNPEPCAERPVLIPREEPVPAPERLDGDSALRIAQLERELAREREARQAAEQKATSGATALTAAQAEIAELRPQLEAALKQFEESKVFVQRARSDMELQRRRFQKEREDLQKCAAEDTLRELFPVLDNFTYAIQLANEGRQDLESLAKGMVMVHRELVGILSRLGLEPIGEAGIPFDPHTHDAASAGTDPDQPNGVILQVLRPGYRLADKILRPAMVRVNKVEPAAPAPLVIVPASEEPLPSPPETGVDPSTDERLSGLSPIERARRILDTKQ